MRLPSRNWSIFWTLTLSFAGAVTYDKWQTKRMREKWCRLVAPIAEESLDAHTAPRRVTIYLAAPPGDGLRCAREHFHTYVKPVLVAAAMDWDVVEGRKEGDVRHKTAERIRKVRQRNGEGTSVEEGEDALTIEAIRLKNGSQTYPGVGGDIVIGRHTWKEYIRGLHEGYLGPADSPKEPEAETPTDSTPSTQAAAQQPANDAPGITATLLDSDSQPKGSESASPTQSADHPESEVTTTTENKEAEQKKDEAEKPTPKRRFPQSPILPENYATATLSASTPEIIGPSMPVRMPHLLGIRNTPIRIYRFLTRRRVADDIGRQVATAVLASHRPYVTVSAPDESSAAGGSVEVPEQQEVLRFEERDWWKTVRQPRQEHEESVFIEPMAFDERILSRMRAFQMTSEDEDRAKSVASGQSKSSDDDKN